MIEVPKFINSPYLIIDEQGWRLKENAPEQLKEEFKEYMEEVNSTHIKEEK
jgi:hypothetical protein